MGRENEWGFRFLRIVLVPACYHLIPFQLKNPEIKLDFRAYDSNKYVVCLFV